MARSLGLVVSFILYNLIQAPISNGEIIVSESENASLVCKYQDILKIPFVTVLDSEIGQYPSGRGGSSYLKTFSLLKFVCVGHDPIEWAFGKLPLKETWNVTYSRNSKNIQDESSMLFESHLTFVNVTHTAFAEYQPTCQQVSNPACHRCTVIINEGAQADKENTTFVFNTSPKNESEEMSSQKNCSMLKMSLSFDGNLQLFYCKSISIENASNTSGNSSGVSGYPKVAFRKCSNPTECGNSKDLDLCHDREPNIGKCQNGTGCAVVRMRTDLETPTVVSCSENGHEDEGVYFQFFHSTVDTAKTQYPTIYFDWEDADTNDLMYLEFSKIHLVTKESFDVSCTMSYFYFAKGAHLTLKDLSDPLHLEVDLMILKNDTLFETIEARQEHRQGILKMTDDEDLTHRIIQDDDDVILPVKRTLVAQGVTLTSPGDYELTCYAPVWNSFHWTAKSVMISVTEATRPEFVNGNETVNLKFHSLINISCIAEGRPAPTIKWIFENEMFGLHTIPLDGSDEMVTWSFLTLPKNIESAKHVFKCRAENLVGYVEKVFILERDDESTGLHSKIAASIMLLGFVFNLVILFFCWKHLFAGKYSLPKFCTMLKRKEKGKARKNCKTDVECNPNCCDVGTSAHKVTPAATSSSSDSSKKPQKSSSASTSKAPSSS